MSSITSSQTRDLESEPLVGGEPSFGQKETRSEFHALLSGCAVYDLDFRSKIALTGSDRVRWLNGMVTNNVRDLGPGFGVYGFLLNPQGRILGDLYAFNRGESLVVDTDRAQLQTILAHFDRYIIMDDVEVASLDEVLAAIGVSGPISRDLLETVGINVADMTPLQVVDTSWNDVNVSVVRGDNPALENYEFWIAPEKLPVLLEALIRTGATLVHAGALDLVRIAAGVPRHGQDIRERDLPQETEQARALHFSKGCYVGQEIVERIRSRGNVHRKFAGFEVHGELPQPGTKIIADGKEVGEITSSANLPLASGERPVALGYIRREVEKLGKELVAGSAKLTVVNLPFPGVFRA